MLLHAYISISIKHIMPISYSHSYSIQSIIVSQSPTFITESSHLIDKAIGWLPLIDPIVIHNDTLIEYDLMTHEQWFKRINDTFLLLLSVIDLLNGTWMNPI